MLWRHDGMCNTPLQPLIIRHIDSFIVGKSGIVWKHMARSIWRPPAQLRFIVGISQIILLLLYVCSCISALGQKTIIYLHWFGDIRWACPMHHHHEEVWVHADGVKFPRTKPLHVSKSHVICFFFVLVKATSLVQHCLRPICHVFLCHLSRHEVFVSFLVKWIVWSISFLTSTWRNTRPNHPLRLARVRTFLTAYRRAPTYKCEVSNRSAPSDSSWQ